MESNQERRNNKRVTFKEPVRYELLNPASFKGTVAYDLSKGGLRIRLPEFLPINTELTLNIQLASGENAECMGRIAWVSQIPYMDQYQAGVEFHHPEIMDESNSRIQEYIQKSLSTLQ